MIYESNSHMPPEPSTNEAVIWRHSGEGIEQDKILSEGKRRRNTLIWWICFVLFFGFMSAFWVSRPGFLETLLSPRFVIEMIVIFALFGVLPKLLRKYFWPFFPFKKPLIATPFWMSSDRIGLITNNEATSPTLNVQDIQSVENDFVMGSPALAVRLKTHTLKLVSSELRHVSKHLYTLRPDLEPTS